MPQTTLKQFILSHSIGRKAGTQRFYTFVEKLIRQHWPEIDTANPTAEDVLLFAKKVSHCSTSYWNSIVAVLRFMFPEHAKLIKRRKGKTPRFVPPGASQWQKLLKECDDAKRGSKAGLVVRFLALSGTRISEAKAIKKADVLYDWKLIRVPPTKSDEERFIPILPGMHPVLQRLFAEVSGEYLLPRENCRKAIANACARAGVKMTHHKFRHYFTTKCIEFGVDPLTVAGWLGHKDKGATLTNTYWHLVNEHSNRMAERVKIAA